MSKVRVLTTGLRNATTALRRAVHCRSIIAEAVFFGLATIFRTSNVVTANSVAINGTRVLTVVSVGTVAVASLRVIRRVSTVGRDPVASSRVRDPMDAFPGNGVASVRVPSSRRNGRIQAKVRDNGQFRLMAVGGFDARGPSAVTVGHAVAQRQGVLRVLHPCPPRALALILARNTGVMSTFVKVNFPSKVNFRGSVRVQLRLCKS